MDMKGGRREGAGRPALKPEEKPIDISLRLPRDLVEKLDAMKGSRAKLIIEACRAYYKIPLAG